MFVELHDGFKHIVKIPASRVVIYDLHDNPIAVVVEIEPGHYVTTTAGDKKFHSVLKALGIDRTVVVDRINPRKLKVLT